MQPTFVTHTLEPIFNENSRILILGSFPSIKSRENNFYYGHPQNRFWKVITAVCKQIEHENQQIIIPTTNKDKSKLLQQHNIALWDVIYSCTVTGSSDSSIKNITPVNIQKIFDIANIQAVFTNGGLSTNLYTKYLQKVTHIPTIQLPSTSPANARFSAEKLLDVWSEKIMPYF